MLVWFALVNLILCRVDGDIGSEDESLQDADFGEKLISSMRNDANLDLSVDEEYEDLRAELLAYHTAFASLTTTPSRRAMMSTPCWVLGGICIDYKLCTGFRFLTEVPACKNKLNVCCFTWNRYKVSDWRDKGIGTFSMPWSNTQQVFGGLGVIEKDLKEKLTVMKKRKRNKNPPNATEAVVFLLRRN